jgi:carbamoyltransferase
LGAALFTWHQLLEHPRATNGHDSQQGSLLGPRYSNEEIESYLHTQSAIARRFSDEVLLLDEVARLLAQGKIVGWFWGRMEFGPRALGARSILGDPRNAAMQATMNLKIKYRESFRPFAPCVLQERASHYFGLSPQTESPYMLLVAPVNPQQRRVLTQEEARTMAEDGDLRKRVNVVRSNLPAVTHVDYSARIQTVDAARHGRFYRLLQAFERTTGCPVLVNTSFNVRGEPIVESPADAYRCFRGTDMDALVMEDFLVLKTDLRDLPDDAEKEQHLAAFSPD